MINIKATGVKKAMLTMDPRVVRRAGSRAINRVAKMARTEASKEIRKKYAIKKADVDHYIHFWPTYRGGLHARLEAASGFIPLIDFRVNVLKRRKGKPGGPPVKVQVLRSKPPTRLQWGFMAEMQTGHRGVFERVDGSGRLPIAELYGPSIISMISHPAVQSAMKRKVSDNFDRLFTHNLNRELAKKRVG